MVQLATVFATDEHCARRILIEQLSQRGLFAKEIEFKDSYESNSANTL